MALSAANCTVCKTVEIFRLKCHLAADPVGPRLKGGERQEAVEVVKVSIVKDQDNLQQGALNCQPGQKCYPQPLPKMLQTFKNE